MKILVLFPTNSEAQYFTPPKGVVVGFTGVGLTASAEATTRLIYEENPDMLIMAGIAGVYQESNLKIGDSILVSSEYEADLGFFFPDGFKHLSDMDLNMDFEIRRETVCPYIVEDMPFRVGTSISMNAAMAPFVNTKGIDVENMEGSAFFYSCLKSGKKFLELRTVSNVVDINSKDEWDYDLSIKNMTDALNKLLVYLQN